MFGNLCVRKKSLKKIYNGGKAKNDQYYLTKLWFHVIKEINKFNNVTTPFPFIYWIFIVLI